MICYGASIHKLRPYLADWKILEGYMNRAMPYASRYAAFVDILGFREIINKSSNNAKLVDELAIVLKSMEDRNAALEQVLGEDFRAQNFSDSIIMSEAVSAQGLSHLLYQVQELALRLLQKGLLIRGGICKGDLYHEGSVIFGPAFIEAYRLERNAANFPRVIIGADVYSDVIQYGNDDDRWKHDFDSDLRFSDDGPVYVHVLKRFAKLNRQEPASLDAEEVVQAQISESALQSLISTSMHEPQHFEKVKWFAVYWNGTVPTGAP
jgi:hypothetical protein